jgi:hypothetical protein
MIKKSIAILLFSLSFIYVYGQSAYNLPPENFYEEATLGFENFQRLPVQNLHITGDSIQYYSRGETHNLHLDEISFIRVKEGTKAGQGALIGAGSAAAISLMAVMDVQTDPDYELKDNAGGTILLFVLGGAAVGGIIGSAVQVEQSYYIHVSSGFDSSYE